MLFELAHRRPGAGTYNTASISVVQSWYREWFENKSKKNPLICRPAITTADTPGVMWTPEQVTAFSQCVSPFSCFGPVSLHICVYVMADIIFKHV